MFNIIGISREQLLSLDPRDITWPLGLREVLYMAKVLDAFWEYDYGALEQGRTGLYAELKSGLHSEAFLVSKIFLGAENIRQIMARQMVMQIKKVISTPPDYVAGIPDGASSLGKEIAHILSVQEAKMEKRDGKIVLVTDVGKKRILLVEDVCTRGTAFIEAVRHITETQPLASVIPYDPVILNRSGLVYLTVAGFGFCKVLSVVEHKVRDWSADECPLCKIGSQVIKPKATDENWRLITTSQK